MEKIGWTKEYQEDLGTKDEKGWYDYEYRYYTYWFFLPNNQEIRGRSYTYKLEHCSIYVALDEFDKNITSENSQMKAYIFGIINFLMIKQDVKTIDYFNQEYKPVDLTKVKNNFKDFIFEEKKSSHGSSH